MSKRKGKRIPEKIGRDIQGYCEDSGITYADFANQSGMSLTTIRSIASGGYTHWTDYTRRRISEVLYNGSNFSTAPRRSRVDVATGKNVPVPTWLIDPLRRFILKHDQLKHVSDKIGVDGSVLRKITEGLQVQARQTTVDRLIAFFKQNPVPVERSPVVAYSPRPKQGELLPEGVHAAEMNQIIGAFNRWNDEQREAFSNFAHAFRSVDQKEEIATLRAELDAVQNERDSLVKKLAEMRSFLDS
jgi:hypothetical protein